MTKFLPGNSGSLQLERKKTPRILEMHGDCLEDARADARLHAPTRRKKYPGSRGSKPISTFLSIQRVSFPMPAS
jgi:hypothetical protein